MSRRHGKHTQRSLSYPVIYAVIDLGGNADRNERFKVEDIVRKIKPDSNNFWDEELSTGDTRIRNWVEWCGNRHLQDCGDFEKRNDGLWKLTEQGSRTFLKLIQIGDPSLFSDLGSPKTLADFLKQFKGNRIFEVRLKQFLAMPHEY